MSSAPESAPPGPADPVVGVVLCGGASTRMGADKALLGPVGAPLVGRVVAALRDAGADDVLLVGGDGDALRAALGVGPRAAVTGIEAESGR